MIITYDRGTRCLWTLYTRGERLWWEAKKIVNRVFVCHCFCFPVLGLSSRSQSTQQKTQQHWTFKTNSYIPEEMARTPCCDKNGLKKGSWTREEDKKLIAYVTKYGHWNWRLLPKFAGISSWGSSTCITATVKLHFIHNISLESTMVKSFEKFSRVS